MGEGGAAAGSGEGVGSEEGWRRGIRARVTALKCHVMATQGLTPQGRVGPAYSPEVLLKEPHNASILRQHDQPAELEAYVTAALQLQHKQQMAAELGGGEERDVADPDTLNPNQVDLEMIPPEESSSQELSISPAGESHNDGTDSGKAGLANGQSSKGGVSLQLHNGDTGVTEKKRLEDTAAIGHSVANNTNINNNIKAIPNHNTRSISLSTNNNNINNNHLAGPGPEDSKIEGSSGQFKWKATFESDNEEDDSEDSPEANGYIRVSAEGDDFDDEVDGKGPATAAVIPAQGRGSGNSSNAGAPNTTRAPERSLSSPATGSRSKNYGSAALELTLEFSCTRGAACPCCRERCLQLQVLQEQLQQRQADVDRLSTIRDEVESELQELTANLFQEAHKMVSASNFRTAAAEKNLKEARMAVDVLTGEVTALKAMVITSTPASPNPHLHPQLAHSSGCGGGKLGGVASSPALFLLSAGDSSSSRQDNSGTSLSTSPSSLPSTVSSAPTAVPSSSSSGLRLFQRGHKKSPSDFDLKYGRDTTPPSSPLKGGLMRSGTLLAQQPPVLDPDCWEVDPVGHREFVAWQQTPGSDLSLGTSLSSSPFLRRVYEEDMSLCLTFPNSALSHALERAVHDNDLYIEEVNARHQHATPSKCVLLEVARFCKYRFRLGSKQPHTWYYISQLARNRIIAVCDFLNYLRYIKQGLVKSSIHDMYWEVVKLRRQMALARLGF